MSPDLWELKPHEEDKDHTKNEMKCEIVQRIDRRIDEGV